MRRCEDSLTARTSCNVPRSSPRRRTAVRGKVRASGAHPRSGRLSAECEGARTRLRPERPATLQGHPRVGGDPVVRRPINGLQSRSWTPAFAGVTRLRGFRLSPDSSARRRGSSCSKAYQRFAEQELDPRLRGGDEVARVLTLPGQQCAMAGVTESSMRGFPGQQFAFAGMTSHQLAVQMLPRPNGIRRATSALTEARHPLCSHS